MHAHARVPVPVPAPVPVPVHVHVHVHVHVQVQFDSPCRGWSQPVGRQLQHTELKVAGGASPADVSALETSDQVSDLELVHLHVERLDVGRLGDLLVDLGPVADVLGPMRVVQGAQSLLLALQAG